MKVSSFDKIVGIENGHQLPCLITYSSDGFLFSRKNDLKSLSHTLVMPYLRINGSDISVTQIIPIYSLSSGFDFSSYYDGIKRELSSLQKDLAVKNVLLIDFVTTNKTNDAHFTLASPLGEDSIMMQAVRASIESKNLKVSFSTIQSEIFNLDDSAKFQRVIQIGIREDFLKESVVVNPIHQSRAQEIVREILLLISGVSKSL